MRGDRETQQENRTGGGGHTRVSLPRRVSLARASRRARMATEARPI
jgi:hypothetical protein